MAFLRFTVIDGSAFKCRLQLLPALPPRQRRAEVQAHKASPPSPNQTHSLAFMATFAAQEVFGRFVADAGVAAIQPQQVGRFRARNS